MSDETFNKEAREAENNYISMFLFTTDWEACDADDYRRLAEKAQELVDESDARSIWEEDVKLLEDYVDFVKNLTGKKKDDTEAYLEFSSGNSGISDVVSICKANALADPLGIEEKRLFTFELATGGPGVSIDFHVRADGELSHAVFHYDTWGNHYTNTLSNSVAESLWETQRDMFEFEPRNGMSRR